jgi:diphthamide biosynthesis protein 4
MDLYAVLNLAPGASPAEIKAYHRALLAAHPDKNNASQPTPDIATIKDAYRVLSSPVLRAKAKAHQDPCPAQVISLADFAEQGADAWTHACRCGSAYAITGAEMDRGVHLVPCTSCSEVVWVGYELAEE